MEKLLIVDRIEGAVAVLEDEDRNPREIPLDALPPGTREGDCLREDRTGALRADPGETRRRRETNRALFDRLRKK